MSFALAEPGLTGAAEVSDEMPEGIGSCGLALSAALHLVLGGVLIVGLPRLFDPPPIEEMPVAVELVAIAPETRATHPNPNLPRPDAKPDVPEAQAPPPKPQQKPEPPKPAPVPPPVAAASPPTEQPALPEAKPEPPPPPRPPEPKPEAKPVEKLDVPKPREKPEPPRQMAKLETKPEEKKAEEKKYDPRQFDALLKNLAPVQTAVAPDAPPQNPRVASARASSQPRAPLGSQLSASELDMVRHQIAHCWNVPAGARDAKDLVVEIKVVVDPDGTVRQATIVDQGRLGDSFFRAAAESARRAFFNPQCRPLHLPPEKYAIWKDLVVDFSPRDVL
ncbi:MAG: energy transducer TonB [Alphaproteobacteria bacterium]|nr:energy transducer TonB [Alphaproteobacteria bacterium]